MHLQNLANQSQIKMLHSEKQDASSGQPCFPLTKQIIIGSKQSNDKASNYEKTAQAVNPVKENKVPSVMKSFLKQRKLLDSFIQIKHKTASSSLTKTEKPFSDQNLTRQQILHDEIRKQQNYQIPIKNVEKKEQATNKQIHDQGITICTICEGIIETKMFKHNVFNCDHLFCKDCTKRYIQYKIKTFQQIYCPNQNCQQILNQKSHFYCNQISLKERKQYIKIHSFFEIHKSDQPKRLCPNQQCDGVISLHSQNKNVKCQTCSFQICVKCFNSSHQGECENYQTKFMKQSFNLVKCQKCKNFIQKSEGCHHISCKCGYQFCEKCKQTWTKSHICKYTGLSKPIEGWGGCDWGITTKDHLLFLVKLPLKAFLIIICAISWAVFSFLGTPLNIIILIYWLYLLFIKPSILRIVNESKLWKILFYIIFFPFFMIINLWDGKQLFISHLDGILPEVSNSFRSIIRL